MMVPRAFASSPFATSPPRYDEKLNHAKEKRRKSSSLFPQQISPSRSPPSRSPPSRSPTLQSKTISSPVQVPGKPHRPRLQPSSPPTSVQTSGGPPRPILPHTPSKRRESVQDVLASTAIPIKRKARQRPSQRIPHGDHVADFSKLLLDDVRTTRESSLSSSLGNPQFDGLFGNLDELVEGQMIVGSEGLGARILSARSLSTESMPSLASPEDFSSADNASLAPSIVRSASDRKFKHLATSEDCATEHPLIDCGGGNDVGDTTPELSISPPQRRPPMRNRKPSAFKSSLTASLKAIKNAAQSVSNYAAPAALQPDDFGGQSFFDFHPSLTDDRRPPPSDQPPSPALRRYLNPSTSTPPDSPAQLHFWIDHRSSDPTHSSHSPPYEAEAPRPKLKIKKKYLKPGDIEASKLSPIVPLADCIPSQIRTAHASSPPVWLAPDGTPSNKRTAAAMWDGTEASLRQCEPRENSDFLRVYVCETQMRRAKKLRDDIEGRAKMWLPPIERDKRRSRPATARLREFAA